MSAENDPALYQSGFERIAKDRYFTDSWVTDAFLRRTSDRLLEPGVVVWEPAAGRGDMASVLIDRGIQVIASDIDLSEFDHGLCPWADMNFVTGEIGFEADGFDASKATAIVTNPPYNLAEEFTRRALAMDRIDFVALLLRSEFDSAGGRVDLFDGHPAWAYEIALTTRPRWDWWFREKPEASPRHNFSWFVWDRKYPAADNPRRTKFWEGKKPRKSS